MENSIKTVVEDGGGRREVYDHDRVDGHFASGLKLRPIPNMTQGQTYEILEEKNAKEVLLGMIYVVNDDEDNRRHISDKYFHPAESVLTFEHSEIDWKNVLSAEQVKEKANAMSNIDEHRDKIKTDFSNCSAIDDMPKVDRSCKPTVRGLKEEYEANIQLNKLAGTWKERTKRKQVRSREDIRYKKSSIEEELELVREGCLDMIDRIDAITNAVEAVRKFA